jgi:hypothetical protein
MAFLRRRRRVFVIFEVVTRTQDDSNGFNPDSRRRALTHHPLPALTDRRIAGASSDGPRFSLGRAIRAKCP